MRTVLLAALSLSADGLVPSSNGLVVDSQQLAGRAPSLLIAAAKKNKKKGAPPAGKGFGESNQKTSSTRPSDEEEPPPPAAKKTAKDPGQTPRQRTLMKAKEICDMMENHLPADSTAVVCPCGGQGIGDGNAYASCCEPYHRGIKTAESPMRVLQARYSAYAVRLPLYLMQTTASESPEWHADGERWALQLHEEGMFDGYQLLQLTTGPVEYGPSGDEAFVDLKVNVVRLGDGNEGVMWERNRFIKTESGEWLYANGELEVVNDMRDPSEEEVIDVLVKDIEVQCDAPGDEKLECETFWEGEVERGQGRRLSSRGVYIGSSDAWGEEWGEEWRKRFSCWWVSLAPPTQSALGSCMGALALHLGSRLDASWRSAQALLGGRVESSVRSEPLAAEPGCEWISEGQLNLPDAPSFPTDLNFQIPPIPRLLPAWQQLQSLGSRQERRERAERSHPRFAGRFVGGIAAGALAGAGTLVLVFAVLRTRRCK